MTELLVGELTLRIKGQVKKVSQLVDEKGRHFKAEWTRKVQDGVLLWDDRVWDCCLRDVKHEYLRPFASIYYSDKSNGCREFKGKHQAIGSV